MQVAAKARCIRRREIQHPVIGVWGEPRHRLEDGIRDLACNGFFVRSHIDTEGNALDPAVKVRGNGLGSLRIESHAIDDRVLLWIPE